MALAYWLPAVSWADGWSVQGFLNLQTPRLSDLAYHLAKLADPAPFAVWTAAVAGIALYRRRPRHALAVVVMLGASNVVAQALKILLATDRSPDYLGRAQINDASFPSGHATASMGLALALVLVSAPRWRPYVAIGGALFALAISESIMLLAWHFPSDVFGGFLVATSFGLLTVAGLRAAEQRWPERSGRAAARRAFSSLDARRLAVTVIAFVGAVLGGIAIAAGDATMHFAEHHTTAVFAAAAVAAMAAALPVTVAALGARRS
ncbi:MAG: hypothetical protein QOJ29_4063 [Thermoleophilaceae bacterium]|jgi:membrane-associated phospholipid phosphatase|nr:hypothetical protein [Thermoleophilaceae bacterium]